MKAKLPLDFKLYLPIIGGTLADAAAYLNERSLSFRVVERNGTPGYLPNNGYHSHRVNLAIVGFKVVGYYFG